MKESAGPVEQMEAIIRDESLKLSAEQTRMHAETILLTAMHEKPMIHGLLLFKASSQGLEYITGVVVALALITRNWSRVVADDPMLDMAKYLEDDDDGCDMPIAHDLVRRSFQIQTVAESDVIREELAQFAERYDAAQFGRLVVHFTFLCADMMTTIIDVADSILANQAKADGNDR